MARQVADIEVEEIHLVDSPANKRKFLLMKSDGSQPNSDVDVIDETEEEKEARLKAEAEAQAKVDAEAVEVKAIEEKAAAEAKEAADKAETEKAAADKATEEALKGPAAELSPELVAALATVSPEAKAEVEAALSKAHLSPEAEKARRIVMGDLLMQMQAKIQDIFEMLNKRQEAEDTEAAEAKAKVLAEEELQKSLEVEVPDEALEALAEIAKSMPSDETLKDLSRLVRARAYA